MSARNRERRQSAARKRAETHSTGFETTLLRIPEGLSFFEPKAGIKTIDIVPYITGKGNPFSEPGEIYFERTFWCWRYLGAEEKTYACLHKTFGKRDPVQEWKNEEAKNPNADQKFLKDLVPKERQLFLIWDGVDPKKLQLWEVSHHLFGKLLDSRIKNSDERMGWDQFYFGDEEGMSLRLTFEEKSGGGYTWLDVTAIDFLRRDAPLPQAVQDHGICLDELIVETPYNDLRRAFLGIEDDEDASGAQPARKGDKPADEKKNESRQEERKTETRTETRQEEKKTEEPKSKTASELGLKVQDEVFYQKVIHTIAKISLDGLSLTLMDSNDEIVKNVPPSSVKLLESAPEKKTEEPKREEPKAEEPKKTEKKEESKKSSAPPKDEDDPNDDDDWNF